MIRTTTPVQIYMFPENPELYLDILVTYVQNGKLVLDKRKQDMEFSSQVTGDTTVYYAKYRFTQEETKRFKPGVPLYTQLKLWKEVNGVVECYADKIQVVSVSDVLNDEVLT